jgi:hypothetical protein
VIGYWLLAVGNWQFTSFFKAKISMLKWKFGFILFFFLIFGCKEKLENEYRFFEDYDLSSGDYKLVVLATEGAHLEGFDDFYIDDVVTLTKMQNQWVFNYKVVPMACGYGYDAKLIKNDQVLVQSSINIECEYMSGWIFFPRNYLTDHIQSFKKLDK